MELFIQICANSHYLLTSKHYTIAYKKKRFKEHRANNKNYWAFVEKLVPSFLCPLSVIEEATGEEYDYDKHILPLIDAGLIWIRPFVNCFPHSRKLELQSRSRHGLCMNNDGRGVCLQFYLGRIDPNKDMNFKDIWI